MSRRKEQKPCKADWRLPLCFHVFNWHVWAADQPERAPGWLAAAEQVYKFFGLTRNEGDAGATLGLVSLGEESPYDLLQRLETRIRKVAITLEGPVGEEWAISTHGLGFNSPRYAAGLAANHVRSVKQSVCPHDEGSSIKRGGGWDEPPWEEHYCKKCKAVVGGTS